MRIVVLSITILFGMSMSAWAGFDQGVAAYERGNYEAARSLYQSVTPTYPGTPFTYEAEQKLRREKLLPRRRHLP